MAKFSNPIAFTKGPVTLFTTLVYAGIIISLIIVHTTLPTLPKKFPKGINITEAWLDLQELTASHHPYNSHSNDQVRDWLLRRIESILGEQEMADPGDTEPRVHVFSDLSSNLTFSSLGSVAGVGTSVYFEGTNIIVYIRGSEDGDDNWWKDPRGKPNNNGGVLVNAHYDSVSTGFGATDDGVGVVSILQLIRYYTTPGNTPKKGLVALFNNGEEDFLNGARAFSQHPLSRFPHTFLNLEGAGAGGKAVLFRSSDTEVTRAYKSSPYPFGSVITADGFKRRLVRSETDYVVFEGELGLRGLDVAFFEPRSRYHTGEDDARHTSKESLWHMLSAALETTKSLTSDMSSTFVGVPSTKGGVGKFPNVRHNEG
jgi:Peptidase family M28